MIIDYGDVWDPTKGYPGEGHPTHKKNSTIDYGDVWDSTKGYPGEGPTKNNNKRKTKSRKKNPGDELWNKTLSLWGNVPSYITKK
jgi:hypothetical protein